MRTLSRIATLIERASAIGQWIACLALALIVALVTVEMLSRALLGVSTQISDEMCGYLSVAVVFLGMAKSLRDGAHVRVEVIYEQFRGRIGTAIKWLIVVASLAYLVVATAVLAKYLAYSFERGLVSNSVAQTPLWIPQLIAVAGAVLLNLQLVAFLLRGCRDLP